MFLLFAVLHENKLTHTDLKPENILFVNSDFTNTYNVEKVTDEFVVGLEKTLFCMRFMSLSSTKTNVCHE